MAVTYVSSTAPGYGSTTVGGQIGDFLLHMGLWGSPPGWTQLYSANGISLSYLFRPTTDQITVNTITGFIMVFRGVRRTEPATFGYTRWWEGGPVVTADPVAVSAGSMLLFVPTASASGDTDAAAGIGGSATGAATTLIRQVYSSGDEARAGAVFYAPQAVAGTSGSSSVDFYTQGSDNNGAATGGHVVLQPENKRSPIITWM